MPTSPQLSGTSPGQGTRATLETFDQILRQTYSRPAGFYQERLRDSRGGGRGIDWGESLAERRRLAGAPVYQRSYTGQWVDVEPRFAPVPTISVPARLPPHVVDEDGFEARMRYYANIQLRAPSYTFAWVDEACNFSGSNFVWEEFVKMWGQVAAAHEDFVFMRANTPKDTLAITNAQVSE